MWPRFVNIALGLWLMAAPAVLNYDGAAADNDHIVGPVIASLACIALWEVTRPLRWINLLLGIWQIVAPWVLGHPIEGQISTTAVGLMVAAMACFGGRIQHRFDGGWKGLLCGVPE